MPRHLGWIGSGPDGRRPWREVVRPRSTVVARPAVPHRVRPPVAVLVMGSIHAHAHDASRWVRAGSESRFVRSVRREGEARVDAHGR